MRIVQHNLFYGNALTVTVEHNGFKGGDQGSGGFVTVILEPDDCFSFEVNGERTEHIEFTARGDWERIVLVNALEMVINELKTHKHLDITGDE